MLKEEVNSLIKKYQGWERPESLLEKEVDVLCEKYECTSQERQQILKDVIDASYANTSYGESLKLL